MISGLISSGEQNNKSGKIDKIIYAEIDELKNHSAGDENPGFTGWRTGCIICFSNLFGEKSMQVFN